MKKITSLLLALVFLCSALVGCAPTRPDDDTKIRIGYMQGPTGIGLAKLINDNGGLDGNESYDFTPYTNSSLASTDLMLDRLDMICLPTNEAAKYANTTNPDMVVLAINCLSALSLLVRDNMEIDSIEDLNGKTILTCAQGTPAIIIGKLLEAYSINANVIYDVGQTTVAKPSDLPPMIKNGKADIILAPEPIASKGMSLITNDTIKYTTPIDIAAAWEAKFNTPIAMGCIVTTREFLDAHKELVDYFLGEYKSSIEYMSNPSNLDTAVQYVLDANIIEGEAPTRSALINLGSSIAYVDSTEMKDALVKIYGIFGNKVIGGKLPADSFYYEK